MLAYKELLGSKLKFGMIALAIGLIVSLTVLMSAMSEGLVTGMTGAKSSLRADVLVFQADSQLEVERSLLSPADLTELSGMAGVETVYPIGHAMAAVERATGSFDARVFGLGGEWQQLPLVEGRAGPLGPGETIVDETAKSEGIELGSTVRLSPAGTELQVVGFTQGRRYVMAPTFYVDMGTWENVYLASALGRQTADRSEQLGRFTGSASIAALDLEEGVDTEELTRRLNGRYEAATPEEASLAGNGMSVMVLAVDAIQIFSLVLGALVIGIFFYVTTSHKSAQLAALKALGASTGYLYGQLLVQIMVLVTVAAVFGILLALAAGASMPPTMAFDAQPARWLVALAGVYVMAVVGSLFSLRGILKIDPAAALDRAEH